MAEPDLRSDETKAQDTRVAKARADERERCAKICEMHAVYYAGTEPKKLMPSASGEPVGKLFAAAIRGEHVIG